MGLNAARHALPARHQPRRRRPRASKNDIIAAITALDERRTQATLDKDAAALDELLDAEMLYVHRSAVCEDKALVNGDVRVKVLTGGQPKDFVSRFLQVWVRRNDDWKLASYHSINVPE